jgi:hypothetical protein
MRILRALCLATAVVGLSLAVAAGTDTAFAGQKNKHKNRSSAQGPSLMIPRDHPKGRLKGDINADFSPGTPHKPVTRSEFLGSAGKHKKRSGHGAVENRNTQRMRTIIDALGDISGVTGGGHAQ